MFIIPHAGFFYGPFETADDAAAFVEAAKIAGPWSIVKLRKPMSEQELANTSLRFQSQYGIG